MPDSPTQPPAHTWVTSSTAAAELVTTPASPQPLDITKLQSGNAIELARLQQMSMQSAQTDPQRLAQMASGRALDMANENTVGNQLSNRDFASAVVDLLEDARSDLVLHYLEHGKSNDPMGPEAAQMWFDKLEHDPEMQQRLLRGDPEIRRQLKRAAMHKGAGPE